MHRWSSFYRKRSTTSFYVCMYVCMYILLVKVCCDSCDSHYASSSEVYQPGGVGTTKCRTHYRHALRQNASRGHVCVDDGRRYDGNPEGRRVLHHNLVRGRHVSTRMLFSSQ